MSAKPPISKLALVTGGSKRIGAVICNTLHHHGYAVICAWRGSESAAQSLVKDLLSRRPDSAWAMRLDLGNLDEINGLARNIKERWGRLDLLVNNASAYFPTEIGATEEEHWKEIFDSNARGPLFLAQSLKLLLESARGSIVSILDADLERAIPGHTVYMMAKAALAAMTRSLALELAPRVRVNAVAPGSILWSAQESADAGHQQAEIERTFLGRTGRPEEVAEAVRWLADEATHTTGGLIHVDGGQHLRK